MPIWRTFVFLSAANWGTSTKFGILIDVTFWRQWHQTNTKPEVVFSGCGRHLEKWILRHISAAGGPIWMKFSGITQNSIELRDMIEIETGSRIRIWRTNVIVAGFRKCRDFVWEGKVFVKNKAMVASRVGCSERGVMYFRKLLFKSDKKKLSFRRVEREDLQSSKKWCVVEHFASEWYIECNFAGWKERKSCVLSAYKRWFKDRDKMRVLSGVAYVTKSRGPRTEPWGTPQRQVCREERLLLHLTRNSQRTDRT